MFVITPTVGPTSRASSVDLSRRAHAHFDGRRAVAGIELHERERHADVVVQVALVLEHRALLLQDAGEHFLGRGLAVRSRDADDGDREFSAVLVRHLLEGSRGYLPRAGCFSARRGSKTCSRAPPFNQRAPGPPS